MILFGPYNCSLYLLLIGIVCFIQASVNDDGDEFIGLGIDSSSVASSRASGSLKEGKDFEDIFMEDSVSVSLNCENTLGSTEEALKSFVMKSLDFNCEETFSDLERPSCRAFFDRNGNFLTGDQIRQLMGTRRGMKLLEEGEVLEFFSDYSDFTLNDFKKFPNLLVSKIRDLSSISAEVLLSLVKEGGFQNAGRLDRIPEMFGERVLENKSWKNDPEIWQLFTLEGITQIESIFYVEKFAKFLADRTKFEYLLFNKTDEDDNDDESEEGERVYDNVYDFEVEESNESKGPEPSIKPSELLATRLRSSSAISADTSLNISPSRRSSVKSSNLICKAFARNSSVLSRWCVQAEELMLYMMECTEVISRNHSFLQAIQSAVKDLIQTRNWLKSELINQCKDLTSSLNGSESLKIESLLTILESSMSWRLKEALRLLNIHQTTDQTDQSQVTPMTQTLKNRLGSSFKIVNDYYRLASPLKNDRLLTLFFSINGIDDLGSIFESSHEDKNDNEKLILSISIRRVLFLLLSPISESSDTIQGALNYVLSSHSPLLGASDSTEIVRWFRQAQDLQAIPVLDRLIRNYGHEFDVSREISSVLDNPTMRNKLFTEAQSSYVKMLAALANNHGSRIISSTPSILGSPYLDPLNALLKTPIQQLPIHPGGRQWTEEQIEKRKVEIESVERHNDAIANFLQVALSFLRSFSAPDSAQITCNFAGFIQHNFKIEFLNSVGVDAGGLRRTWLSSIFRVFGDAQRQLFPLHLSPEGGRIPSALLDPEIMSYLGALHGKALQIGVKPDWFFNPSYTQNILYSQTIPTQDDLLRLTEEIYPQIMGSLDLILDLDSESESVDYFNSSGYPAIVGLLGQIDDQDQDQNIIIDTDENEGKIEDAQNVYSPLQNQSDNDSPGSFFTQESSLDGVEQETLDGIAHEIFNQRTSTVLFDSSPLTTLSPSPNLEAHTNPLYHSFSRMLVFEARYLAQKSIYSGPRLRVSSVSEIIEYRAAILELFSRNLLQGREAYWRTFSIFFEDRFRSQLNPEFLHDLFAPPTFTIEEIMTRVNFHRECDSIYLIDDENEFDGPDEDSKEDIPNKKYSRPTSPSGNLSLNISARDAISRILLTSFTSQTQISSLLSFSTGCPQLPPAGLDAFRLTINCFPSTSPQTRLSKSHTCGNTIDFFSSCKVKETRDSFIESVLSSSGFGFA